MRAQYLRFEAGPTQSADRRQYQHSTSTSQHSTNAGKKAGVGQ